MSDIEGYVVSTTAVIAVASRVFRVEVLEDLIAPEKIHTIAYEMTTAGIWLMLLDSEIPAELNEAMGTLANKLLAKKLDVN